METSPLLIPPQDSNPVPQETQETKARRSNFLMRTIMRGLHYPAMAAVGASDFIGRNIISAGDLYRVLLIPGPLFESLRWKVGAWRAWRSFHKAYKEVPAYRDYIDRQGGIPDINLKSSMTPDLTSIPETDKQSYVKAYPITERVTGGILPRTGVMVDESSGSSGTPTSWVRGEAEREMVSRMIQLSFRNAVDRNRPTFILNAFALGAWATGMNVAMSLTNSSILKSTGPNIDKIVSTMLEFGPDYHYVIMGYPPFLKTLADDKRIDWNQYTADAGYGGEGISESLRNYLSRCFKRVVGSYGASDLEINMAIETDSTISLRRAITDDPKLREEIIRTDYGVTPMIFQYNPFASYIETNQNGELVVTLARPDHIAPKPRYNIHDRGHVMRMPELITKLHNAGRSDLVDEFSQAATDLPLLFLYGRSDMSIDYYGANVTPDSLREVLYSVETLAPSLHTFRLQSREDETHTKRMEIAVELEEGATVPPDGEQIAEEVFARLAKINGDFANAYYRTASRDNMPQLTFHPFGTGPFAGGQTKLKHSYVDTGKAPGIVYDNLS